MEAGIKLKAIEKIIAEINPSAVPSISSIDFVFLNMATVTSISKLSFPVTYLPKAVFNLLTNTGKASLWTVEISKKYSIVSFAKSNSLTKKPPLLSSPAV